MARQEHEREDLFAEATALVRRVELTVPGEAGPIVIGVRRDGCLSFYFDADHAYHFNTCHELRRAYLDDRLIKAEGGQLIALRRKRGDGEVQLLASALSPIEEATVLSELTRRTNALQAAIVANKVTILRQSPADWQALAGVSQWLAALAGEIAIARAPHAR
jgi:hypothetical protein